MQEGDTAAVWEYAYKHGLLLPFEDALAAALKGVALGRAELEGDSDEVQDETKEGQGGMQMLKETMLKMDESMAVTREEADALKDIMGRLRLARQAAASKELLIGGWGNKVPSVWEQLSVRVSEEYLLPRSRAKLEQPSRSTAETVWQISDTEKVEDLVIDEGDLDEFVRMGTVEEELDLNFSLNQDQVKDLRKIMERARPRSAAKARPLTPLSLPSTPPDDFARLRARSPPMFSRRDNERSRLSPGLINPVGSLWTEDELEMAREGGSSPAGLDKFNMDEWNEIEHIKTMSISTTPSATGAAKRPWMMTSSPPMPWSSQTEPEEYTKFDVPLIPRSAIASEPMIPSLRQLNLSAEEEEDELESDEEVELTTLTGLGGPDTFRSLMASSPLPAHQQGDFQLFSTLDLSEMRVNVAHIAREATPPLNPARMALDVAATERTELPSALRTLNSELGWSIECPEKEEVLAAAFEGQDDLDLEQLYSECHPTRGGSGVEDQDQLEVVTVEFLTEKEEYIFSRQERRGEMEEDDSDELQEGPNAAAAAAVATPPTPPPLPVSGLPRVTNATSFRLPLPVPPSASTAAVSPHLHHSPSDKRADQVQNLLREVKRFTVSTAQEEAEDNAHEEEDEDEAEIVQVPRKPSLAPLSTPPEPVSVNEQEGDGDLGETVDTEDPFDLNSLLTKRKQRRTKNSTDSLVSNHALGENTFYSSRNLRFEASSTKSRKPENVIEPASAEQVIHLPPEERPKLPFPTPAFLGPSPPGADELSLKVVASIDLLQRHRLYEALSVVGLTLVERELQPGTPTATYSPHLILGATSCVYFESLVDVVGNAFRVEELSDGGAGHRREALVTTLSRLASSFSQILLVITEKETSAPGNTNWRVYTPAVMRSLSELQTGIGELYGLHPNLEVHVAVVEGPKEAAQAVAGFCRHARDNALDGVWPDEPAALWDGSRGWLLTEAHEDEEALLQVEGLNPITASAILSICSLEALVAASAMDRAEMLREVASLSVINNITRRIQENAAGDASSDTFAPVDLSQFELPLTPQASGRDAFVPDRTTVPAALPRRSLSAPVLREGASKHTPSIASSEVEYTMIEGLEDDMVEEDPEEGSDDLSALMAEFIEPSFIVED